jgi:hypothetical protein
MPTITIDPPDRNGDVLIRGQGLLPATHLVPSVRRDTRGILVHRDFLNDALTELRASGYTPPAPSPPLGSMPLPLPECSNPECRAPYRRTHVVAPGEACWRCGQPLVLEQHDPNVPPGQCPHCERA